MLTLEELHAHYKAVRERLSGPPPKPSQVTVIVPEPEPEPVKEELPTCTILNFPFDMASQPGNVIIQTIAMKHGVTVKDIKSQSRKREHVLARQEAAYELREKRKFSLTKIGIMLGNRDHTTILHACRKHEERLAKVAFDEPSE